MNRIFRQFPIINPEWDKDEELIILKQEAEHDWDDERQEAQWNNLHRWHDLLDRDYNKRT